jgi:RNA polymerase sigma-70 factor (ECF subfamily)
MVTAILPLVIARSGTSPVGANTDESHLGHDAAGEPDDGALVTAVAAGDVAALDLLYRRHRSLALGVACKLLRDRAAAEDVVHDAFLSVWRAAASFQPGRGSPRAWLLTIVRNAAIDSLRARELAQRPRTTRARLQFHAPLDEDIGATVAMAAEARRLGAALTALPPEQRSAIELAFFAGLTHDQIAARTGAPLGTVKGRVRLGLRRLRRDLQDPAPQYEGDKVTGFQDDKGPFFLTPQRHVTPSPIAASGLNDPTRTATPYDRATLR